MRVSLTDHVSIEAPGIVIDEARFPGRQGRLVFAYLLGEHGHPVPRGDLAEALWGDSPPATWEKALSVLVSKLRALLAECGVNGAEALTSAFGCYQLVLPPGTWIDVVAAEHAAAAAERALGSGDLEQARSAAATAESLARGTFLPGEDARWVAERRAEQRKTLARALECLSEVQRRVGQPGAAVRAADELIALEPYRERGYRLLMQAQSAAGNDAEALRVYERCRRLLAAELGTYPSGETEALYRQLLGTPAVRVAALPPDGHLFVHRAAPPPEHRLGNGSPPAVECLGRSNLPAPAHPLVGRERELADVARLLTGSDARIVTLTGPGGVGKTRLAVAVAGEVAEGFEGGVWFVRLALLRDPALVLPSVAGVIGADGDVARHLGSSESLIVLDNLEHVIASASDVADLVRRCPRLRVLITSREALQVSAEHAYAVQPLAEVPSVELFRQRAASFTPEGEIEYVTAAEICARLDRLPLAIELAAARTKSLLPEQILERLPNLDLLKGGRDADPRQRTLRATIEWSYEILAPDEQALFSRLSIFAGGCTLDAAEEVATADLDSLQSLVEKSLVRFTNGRYWMLETIREFAAEQLDAAEADRLLERLAGYLVSVAEAEGAPMFRGRQEEAFARLEPEHPNTRAVMRWALANGRTAIALELIRCLGLVWSLRGHVREAVEWIDASLEHRNSVSARTRVGAVITAIDVMKPVNRWDRVAELAEELVAIAAGNDDVDPLAAAAAMADLSDIALDRGDRQGARAWAERSLEWRNAHDLPGARALMSLAELALEEGEPDRAERLYEQAAESQAVSGHDLNRANSLRGGGEAARRRGDLARATAYFAESLEIHVRLGDQFGVGDALRALARVACDEGHPERAGTLWGAGSAILTDCGAKPEHRRPEPEVPSEAVERGERMSYEEAVAYACAFATDRGSLVD